jgi:(R,R)-butanediol dehydrogenase / meso-butanediol dehydrogenase / diacetyl reductase
MQVGLVTGKRKIDLVEMPDPDPSPGKVVVDISYCGICGTDVHAYLSGEPYNPAICGHEWVGNADKIGAGVTHVKEGDRVAIGVATACGQCATCQRGDAAHCELAFAGAIGAGPMAAPHGGFARSIAFDGQRLYHVPDTLTDAQAGLLEPATVAVHALRRTPINLGDSVIVIGAGPIGLLVLQAARLSGAGQLVLVEPEPSRRALGAQLGATLSVDPLSEEADSLIQAHIGTGGADVVFECAGIPSTIQTAVNQVRRGGVVSLVGVANGAATIDAASWLIKEIRMTSSIAYLHEDFEICKALVADGRILTDPLHTSTVALSELDQAFNRLADHPAEVKILVDPRL